MLLAGIRNVDVRAGMGPAPVWLFIYKKNVTIRLEVWMEIVDWTYNGKVTEKIKDICIIEVHLCIAAAIILGLDYFQCFFRRNCSGKSCRYASHKQQECHHTPAF
ncbi:hypothetical protein [uncultured Prevotella sp.]|uniref:hypothetical protein n=1 Tax=uncultured Prevotella sp. TaxID=159272 RepID=UPI002804C86B|nr:hypothetical protein [uncultured Prevotella sp.]